MSHDQRGNSLVLFIQSTDFTALNVKNCWGVVTGAGKGFEVTKLSAQ